MEKYTKINTLFKRQNEKPYQLTEEFTLPEFRFLSANTWVWTEKVDGTNIRIQWDGENVVFKGKSDNADVPSQLMEKYQKIITPEKMTDVFGDTPVCLYGEGYGGKIQNGHKFYSKTEEFVLFDVNIDEWWLERHNLEDVANKLNVDIVPIIGEGNLFEMRDTVKPGFKSTWGDFNAEGIVAKPKIDLFTRKGKRLITKLKEKDFK